MKLYENTKNELKIILEFLTTELNRLKHAEASQEAIKEVLIQRSFLRKLIY